MSYDDVQDACKRRSSSEAVVVTGPLGPSPFQRHDGRRKGAEGAATVRVDDGLRRSRSGAGSLFRYIISSPHQATRPPPTIPDFRTTSPTHRRSSATGRLSATNLGVGTRPSAAHRGRPATYLGPYDGPRPPAGRSTTVIYLTTLLQRRSDFCSKTRSELVRWSEPVCGARRQAYASRRPAS